jgi:hypothetical protein
MTSRGFIGRECEEILELERTQSMNNIEAGDKVQDKATMF